MGKKILVVMLLCAAIATTFGLSDSVNFFAVGTSVLKPVASLADKAMNVIKFLLPTEKAEDPYNTQFYVPQSAKDTIYLYRVYFGENNEYYVDFNCIENKLRPFKRDWYVMYTNCDEEWHVEEYILPSDIKFSYDYELQQAQDGTYYRVPKVIHRSFYFYPLIKPQDYRSKMLSYTEYLNKYFGNSMTYEQYMQTFE